MMTFYFYIPKLAGNMIQTACKPDSEAHKRYNYDHARLQGYRREIAVTHLLLLRDERFLRQSQIFASAFPRDYLYVYYRIFSSKKQ
jgi:hypothetical protein